MPCSAIYWCFPPHLPGLVEAGLHCIYTGFFIIEASTYGLHLEQKFHGVLQILLINFYIVLLCILFIRWHVSRKSLGCHLFISLASCALTVFIGNMILMYLNHMEQSMGEKVHRVEPDPMKLDLIILILDMFFYILITCSYIILLVRISLQINKSVRQVLDLDESVSVEMGRDHFYDVEDTVSTVEGSSSFAEEISGSRNLARF